MERILVLVLKFKEMLLIEGIILIVLYFVLKFDIMMMFKNVGFFQYLFCWYVFNECVVIRFESVGFLSFIKLLLDKVLIIELIIIQ